MNENNLPKISIIIPTYNAEKYLEKCLLHILRQEYKKEKIEIVVVDDNSTDRTKEIAMKYGIKILENGTKNAEIGKAIGLKNTSGDLVYFSDSDVIIDEKIWIKEMIRPFIENRDVAATECSWGIFNDFTSINKYAALLGIADPLARMLTNRNFPKSVQKKKSYNLYTYTKDQNPVLFCVVWKRKFIKKIPNVDKIFLEGYAPIELINQGHNLIAHSNKVFAYHYYVNSFSDYIKKRQKIARKFLTRRDKEVTWVDKGGNFKLYLSSLYLGTIIGPTLEGVFNALKHKRASWLWHPIVSFVTIVVYSYFYIKKKKQSEPYKK